MTNRRAFLGSAAAVPRPPRAAPPPNRLVVMTDQHRFSALPCAGNLVLQTPHLDRLAGEGALFQTAITPCPVCVPALTSILTGNGMTGTTVTANAAATDAVLDCGPSFDNLLSAPGDRAQYRRQAGEMMGRLLEWLARAGRPLAAGVRERNFA